MSGECRCVMCLRRTLCDVCAHSVRGVMCVVLGVWCGVLGVCNIQIS